MAQGTQARRLAQASVETLLVFLIFLSAFGVAYAASSRLASAAQSRLDVSLSQSSFSDFAAKLQSACSLGSGNVRIANISGSAASLSSQGANSVAFRAGSFSSGLNSSCRILLRTSSPSRSFRIENRDGTIEISGAG